MRTRPTRFIATIVGVLSGLASATGSCSTIDELWPTAGVRITVQTNAYVRHSYRAHVDGNLSAYTLTPAGIFLVEVSNNRFGFGDQWVLVTQ